MGPTDVQRAPVSTGFSLKQPFIEFCCDVVDSQPVSSRKNSDNANTSREESNPLSSFTGSSVKALRNEALRFATFKGWPHSFLPARAMAEAGFFFRGQGDQAQCAFCLIIISHWEPSDEPMSEHKRHAPNCPFVRGMPVGNVPANAADVQNARFSPAGLPIPQFSNSSLDTCARYVHEFRPAAHPEQANRDEQAQSTGSSGLQPFRGVHVHERAKRPELSTLESRLKTFRDWPPGLAQRPAVLAEAGFYYMCTGDRVQCFCCEGSLRNWEPTDDPWEEHARWFSRCTFLAAAKGTEYVREVLQKSMGKKEEAQASQQENEKPEEETNMSAAAKPVDECGKGSGDLQNALLCKICFDQPMSIVFLPCGHSMSCPSCAAALGSCPLCRKPIEASVKAFFSFS